MSRADAEAGKSNRPMLMGNLLRLVDVAEFLQTGKDRARDWLKANGLPAMDMGAGPGGGLRWRKSDVEDAIEVAMQGSVVKRTPPRVFQRFITGKSMAEIRATLTQAPPA